MASAMRDGSSEDAAQHRTLRAMGVTMIGVLCSVALTVGFGVAGPWWLRLAAGVAAGAALLLVVKLGTAQGSKGLVAHAADWLTGEARREP